MGKRVMIKVFEFRSAVRCMYITRLILIIPGTNVSIVAVKWRAPPFLFGLKQVKYDRACRIGQRVMAKLIVHQMQSSLLAFIEILLISPIFVRFKTRRFDYSSTYHVSTGRITPCRVNVKTPLH